MDNRKLFIQEEGKEALYHALMLAFYGAPGGKATHYMIHDGDLLLLWADDRGAIKLPYPLTKSNVVDFVWNWIEGADKKEKYNDGEVDNLEGGFRLQTNSWGHDDESHYAFARISAVWAWCGK